MHDIWRVFFDTDKERWLAQTVAGKGLVDRANGPDPAAERAGVLSEVLMKIDDGGWTIVNVLEYDDEILFVLRK